MVSGVSVVVRVCVGSGEGCVCDLMLPSLPLGVHY